MLVVDVVEVVELLGVVDVVEVVDAASDVEVVVDDELVVAVTATPGGEEGLGAVRDSIVVAGVAPGACAAAIPGTPTAVTSHATATAATLHCHGRGCS